MSTGPAVPPPLSRLESVQILRGVAAMMVVFHHAGRFLALNPHYQPGDSRLVPSEAVAQLGATGVDLFFVISGFVMALSARRFVGTGGAGVFLAQRFIRIAPLFYLACLVMLAEALRAGTPVELPSVLNSITFIPVFDDDVYSWPLHYLGWTLAFEFVFYLVVAALIAGGREGRHATLLVATLALPLLGFLLQAPLILWKVLTNPIIWEFALGIVACMLWERRWLERLRVPLAVVVGAALIAAAVAVRLRPEFLLWIGDAPVEGATTAARAFWWGIPAFAFFCLVIGLPSAGDGRLARLLKLLGDASYSIYLSHLFVILVMGSVIKHLSIQPDWVVVGTLVLSAVVGIAAYRLVEKPMLTAGQRRIRGWSLRHMHAGAGRQSAAEGQAPG